MANEKKRENKKKETLNEKNVIDHLIERYPGYEKILMSERHIYESIKKIPNKHLFFQLIHLVECVLSKYAINYKSIDYSDMADKCMEHLWEKRDSFAKGGHEENNLLGWILKGAENFAKDCLQDAQEIIGFDSSDISEDGCSIIYGYRGMRNRLTEKGQNNEGIIQNDYMTEQEIEEREKFNQELRNAHLAQLRAEKRAFTYALNKVLSELRPDARILYDSYNQHVPFEEICRRIQAKSIGAVKTRRVALVKSMQEKIIKYWSAPAGYHYADPLEPMMRQLMEITFFKGWNIKREKTPLAR